jgi:MATE family multidrug resistance protein
VPNSKRLARFLSLLKTNRLLRLLRTIYQTRFAFNTIDRELFAFALPALGGLAIDPLVSLVDTAFIGRLGAAFLAALGINTSLFSLAFFGFNFLANATTPMISTALGNHDRDQAGKVAVQALVLAWCLGVVITGLLISLATPLLKLMGASESLLPLAAQYLQIRALAAPALLTLIASRGILYGHGDARTVLRVVTVLNLVNIVLDPLFIFGFGWGLAGAAWATTLAQYVGAVWFVLSFVRHSARFAIQWYMPPFGAFVPLLKSGSLLTVRTLALITTMSLATAVAARVDVVTVAAHQVVSQLWLLMALTLDALAETAKTLIPRYLGEKPARAKAVANRALFWSVVVGLGLAVLFALGRPLFIRAFTDDPEVIRAVSAVFPFVILMQPLNGLVFVWDGIFMGLNRWSFLAFAMIASCAVSALVLLLVIPFGWGLTGVWWGLVILIAARAMTFTVPYIRYLRTT